MRNIKLSLPAVSLFFCSLAAFTATADDSSGLAGGSAAPPYREWTVSAGIGSEGIIGVGTAWRFSDHMGVRLGVNGFSWQFHEVGIAGIHYDAKLRLLNEPITFDVYPWLKSSFRVSLGFLVNQNQLTGSANDTGTIIIDGMPFPSDQVGSLNMKVEQHPLSPYLSIGGNLFYFDRPHHWSVSTEVGIAYTGNGLVDLTRTGPPNALIDAAVDRAKVRLQNYADKFAWWPVVKLGVSYSF